MNKPATIGDGIEVKPSSITGAGNGLWVTRDFVKNELVSEYDGARVTRNEALELRRLNAHSHVRSVDGLGDCIDGLKVPIAGRGGASFANDGRTCKVNNVCFVKRYDSKTAQTKVYLKALVNIPAGTEVFVSYGTLFWDWYDQMQDKLPCPQMPAEHQEQQGSLQQLGGSNMDVDVLPGARSPRRAALAASAAIRAAAVKELDVIVAHQTSRGRRSKAGQLQCKGARVAKKSSRRC